MKWYRADLHIHSVLSPCSGLEMSPRNIMKRAKDKGLSLISITDHNSMANCAVYEKAAHEQELVFFWGMEIQTIEEIHLIVLFYDSEAAKVFDVQLYESLLPLKNNPDYFGDQVVIDEDENIIRFEEKALINSSRWTLEEVVKRLEILDAFFFPAHIDSDSYSIIGQLGFIPPELKFPALGITAKCDLDRFLRNHRELSTYSFIRNSDAHYLEDIGSGYTDFYLQTPTIQEMRLACQKTRGRKNVI